MTSLKPEVEEFLESEENVYFSLKKTDDNDITFLIDEEYVFHVSILSKGKFKVTTAEEFLDEWCEQVNTYCNQGKKIISDVLIKATDSYTEFLSSPTEEEVELEFDDVMEEDDTFIVETKKKAPIQGISYEDYLDLLKNFGVEKSSTKQATDRLMKDYIELCKTDNSKYGFSASPIKNNLYHWEIRFFDFEKSICPDFVNDLKKYAKNHNGQDYVKLEMKFKENYPYRPPFIRVISPRFAFHTGRVTVGGSICFELLTQTGWNPVISLESIFLQIKLEMTNGSPRIDFGNNHIYSESEAKEAFFRVANDHKWDTKGL
eukprot:gene8109-12570_t